MATAHANLSVILAVVIGLIGSTALAEDTDGDSVDDAVDVCAGTPSGIPVDSEGRPIADIDEDCDVDMNDLALLCLSFTGPFGCSPEVCDGLDNDCNGFIDDMGTLACGVGACLRQVEACIDGVPQTCVPGEPAPEDCTDSLDNDCDGAAACEDSDCEGAPCNDGSYCTEGERCADGTCTGGAPLDCSDLDYGCTQGVCSEDLGACEVTDIPDGFRCNDENVCTTEDTCLSGECKGTPLPDQSDARACDDGDPETDRSFCVLGECVATTTYGLNSSIDYSCPAAGTAFMIVSFEFADTGDMLAVFGAHAAMFDEDGIGPDGSFLASGSITDGACTQTYSLNAQFIGPSWTGTFRAEFVGCGGCLGQTWASLTGTPE